MPLIDKSQLPLVALDSMNEVHFEEVDMVNELSDLIDAYEGDEAQLAVIATKFAGVVEHTREHFASEERLMLETGFAPYPMHKGEHDKQLARVGQVVSEWDANRDVDQLKAFLQAELPAWVVNHIQSMDAVTAMYIAATRR